MQAVSHFLGNKTVAATRLYWSRHRERLGLDAIMAERAAAGLGAEDHAPGAATAVPVAAAAAAAGLPDLQQSWAPLLDHLQRQAAGGEGPADAAAAKPAAGEPAAAQPGGGAAEGEPGSGQTAAAAEAAAGREAMQVDAPAAAEAAAVKPEPEQAAPAPAGAGAAAAGTDQAAAGEGKLEPAAAPVASEQAGAAGIGEAVPLPLASAAEAASLLPREELAKLQTLLEPGAGAWYPGGRLACVPPSLLLPPLQRHNFEPRTTRAPLHNGALRTPSASICYTGTPVTLPLHPRPRLAPRWHPV